MKGPRAGPRLTPLALTRSARPETPTVEWSPLSVRPADASPLHGALFPPAISVPPPGYSLGGKLDIGYGVAQALLQAKQREVRSESLRSFFTGIAAALESAAQTVRNEPPMLALYSMLLDALDAIIAKVGGIGFFFLPESGMEDFGFPISPAASPRERQLYVFSTSAMPTYREMNMRGLQSPVHTPLFRYVLEGKVPRLFTRDDLAALQEPLELHDGTRLVRCRVPPGHFGLNDVLLLPLHPVGACPGVLLGLANGSYTQDILTPLRDTVAPFLRAARHSVERERARVRAQEQVAVAERVNQLEDELQSLACRLLRAPFSDGERLADLVAGLGSAMQGSSGAAAAVFFPIYAAPPTHAPREGRSSCSSATALRDLRLGQPVCSDPDLAAAHLSPVLAPEATPRLLRAAGRPPECLTAAEAAAEFEGYISPHSMLLVPIQVGIQLCGLLAVGGSDVVAPQYGPVLAASLGETVQQMREQAVGAATQSAVQAQWGLPPELIPRVAEEYTRRSGIQASIDEILAQELRSLAQEVSLTAGGAAAEEFQRLWEDPTGMSERTPPVEVSVAGAKGVKQLIRSANDPHARAARACRAAAASRDDLIHSHLLWWQPSPEQPIGLLLADMQSSSSWMSALGPGDFAVLLTDMWGALDSAAGAFGMTKLKTFGDRILYLTGVPPEKAVGYSPKEKRAKIRLAKDGPRTADGQTQHGVGVPPGSTVEKGIDESKSLGSISADTAPTDCSAQPARGSGEAGEVLLPLIEFGCELHSIAEGVWEAWRDESVAVECAPAGLPLFRAAVVSAAQKADALPLVRDVAGRPEFDLHGRSFSLADRLAKAAPPGRGVLTTDTVAASVEYRLAQRAHPDDSPFTVSWEEHRLRGHGGDAAPCALYARKAKCGR